MQKRIDALAVGALLTVGLGSAGMVASGQTVDVDVITGVAISGNGPEAGV